MTYMVFIYIRLHLSIYHDAYSWCSFIYVYISLSIMMPTFYNYQQDSHSISFCLLLSIHLILVPLIPLNLQIPLCFKILWNNKGPFFHTYATLLYHPCHLIIFHSHQVIKNIKVLYLNIILQFISSPLLDNQTFNISIYRFWRLIPSRNVPQGDGHSRRAFSSPYSNITSLVVQALLLYQQLSCMYSFI